MAKKCKSTIAATITRMEVYWQRFNNLIARDLAFAILVAAAFSLLVLAG